MSDSRLTKTQIRPAHFAQPADAQPQTAPEPERLIFGRYRLLEQRAVGGFGEVYVCWDVRLQRRVAIKRLELRAPNSPATPLATIDEALAEARTSSLLQHPNIVTVLDFETDGQSAFLVMEYIDGLSLAELLQRVEGGVLTYEESAHVIASIGSALAYAHDNGVLHLDIKPSNVLIDRSGQVKLSDFGMATLASAAGYGGARGGTIGYMSPEQLAGDVVDERSDVFSLAVVSYEMLSGKNPFMDTTVEGSLKRIEKGAKLLSKYEVDLRGAPENLVSQAFEPNPSFRLADVEDFSSRLAQSLGDAAEGAASLVELLDQLEDDEDYVEAIARRRVRHVPPWLSGALLRIAAAAALAWFGFQIARTLGLEGRQEVMIGLAAVSLISALWPPASVPFAGIGFAAALVYLARSRLSVVLAAGIVVVLGIWWIVSGRKKPLTALSLVLPAALMQPLAAPALAARACRPFGALIATALSWIFAVFVQQGLSLGLSSDAMVSAMASYITQPHNLLACGGAILASVACSALSRARMGTYAIAAQLLGAVIVIFSQLIASRMENGGIWSHPDWGQLVVAVVCFLLMGVAAHLFGAPQSTWEDER
ncbi:MAG: serine/threonine protein kinase [Atopobiaceae bacterium]|nr:serine/threonine protein kinase [Atopobiaceae bacterium]